MKMNVEAAALTILIQIDQVTQLKEAYFVKKIHLRELIESGQDFADYY